MAHPPKKQRGRPKRADGQMRQIAVRFPEEMLAEIDAIIAGRMDKPDRSAIIREAVATWLINRKSRDSRSG